MQKQELTEISQDLVNNLVALDIIAKIRTSHIDYRKFVHLAKHYDFMTLRSTSKHIDKYAYYNFKNKL